MPHQEESALYLQIRSQAQAMLQATNVAAVHELALQISQTQAQLLEANNPSQTAPSYWLAPSLAALAAWVQNDQPLAKKALSSSWRLSPENTLLFFAIVLRQAGRAYLPCLETYLDRALQSPNTLTQEADHGLLALSLADQEQLRDALAEELKAGLSAKLQEKLDEAKVSVGAYMEAAMIAFLALAGGIAGLTPAFLLLLAPVGLLAFQFRRARRARAAIWQKFADLGQQWATPRNPDPALGNLNLEPSPAAPADPAPLALALPAWSLLTP